MPRQSYTCVIDCSPTEVFDYLARFEHDHEWRSGVVEMRPTNDIACGVGASHVEVRKVPGRTIETAATVTEFDPPKRIAFGRNDGPIRPQGSYDLEPTTDGTQLTCTIEVPLAGAKKLLAPAVALMLRAVVKPTMPKDFARLTNLLEAGTSTP